MLTDYVVATKEEAESVSVSQARQSTWPCFSCNSLDNSVLAALWAALDSSADTSILESTSQIIFSGGKEGPWVFDIPHNLISSLANIPNHEILNIAERWVQQPELAHADWQGADVAPAIEALRSIASQAIQLQKTMLLWMSL